MPYTLKPQSSLKTTFSHLGRIYKTDEYVHTLLYLHFGVKVCSFTDGDIATPLTSRLSLAFVGSSELLV